MTYPQAQVFVALLRMLPLECLRAFEEGILQANRVFVDILYDDAFGPIATKKLDMLFRRYGGLIDTAAVLKKALEERKVSR